MKTLCNHEIINSFFLFLKKKRFYLWFYCNLPTVLLSIPFNKLPYTAGWTVLLRIVIVIVVSKHVLVLTRIKQKKWSWDSKASWSLVLDRLKLNCLRARPQQRAASWQCTLFWKILNIFKNQHLTNLKLQVNLYQTKIWPFCEFC